MSRDNLRLGRVNDLPDLVRIESAQRFGWSPGQLSHSLATGQVHVLERGGELIGFGVLQLVLDELSLLNISIDCRYRKQGLATLLLESVLAEYQRKGAVNCFLEVRESNLPAIRLYQKLGFCQQGLRKNYYPADTGREHALIFTKPLPAED